MSFGQPIAVRRHVRRGVLVAAIASLTVSVAACSSSDTDEAATSTTGPEKATTTTVAAPTSEPPETSEPSTTLPSSPTTATPSPPTDAPAASELAGFEEYAVLQSTIGNLDSLTPEIETDNPNTRVILYADADGRKVYKSIYVKRNNRLKVIDLNGGGPPLYNDTI